MEVQYPLVFFTLLLCLTSGVLAIQGWLLIVGKGSQRFHTAAIVVELAALVLGGISSFLHLHHWERIFNGFGHITSGITQELIGVVVTLVAMAIVFGFLRRAAKGSTVPKWVGVVALVVGVIMGFVCAHSYYMESIPAWSNVTLYLFYYSSEFVLGACGIWAIAALCKEEGAIVGTLARLGLISGVVSLVVMAACGFYYTTLSFNDVGISFHTTDPTAPDAVSAALTAVNAPFSGEYAPLFWGGAVCVGSLVPAVLAFVGMRKPESSALPGVAAIVCALIGGVAFRVVLYIVGITAFVYF